MIYDFFYFLILKSKFDFIFYIKFLSRYKSHKSTLVIKLTKNKTSETTNPNASI